MFRKEMIRLSTTTNRERPSDDAETNNHHAHCQTLEYSDVALQPALIVTATLRYSRMHQNLQRDIATMVNFEE